MAEIEPCAELLPNTPLPDGAPPVPELGSNEQLEVYGAGDGRAVVICKETEDELVIRHHWSSNQDASLAQQLLVALRRHHGGTGKRLMLSLLGDQTALFGAIPENAPGGQIMVKPVDSGVVIPADVTYRPMDTSEAQLFVAECRSGFPHHMRENRPSLTMEKAEEMTAKAFEMAQPQGLESPGHSYLIVETASGREVVAHLWIFFNEEKKESFCYYILVNPESRRKGYGAKTLAAWEHYASKQGAQSLRLNVFRKNAAARALYHKGGFKITEGSFTVGE
ncbi:acyl-CoA N-acyltransferase [Thozetella sp. PMI_491]|nr:acyl-CoA N-acyltransferase [Thozetella sp. PMI_491]